MWKEVGMVEVKEVHSIYYAQSVDVSPSRRRYRTRGAQRAGRGKRGSMCPISVSDSTEREHKPCRLE